MEKTFIDLFAGCGGMSKGLELAGFRCVGFVEFWQPAINTHQNNCNGELIGKDILQIKDEELKKFRGKVDLICGGPPCQGFSMAGKRDPKDPRNKLFLEFIRFIRVIRPKFFIMENVQGIASMKDENGDSIYNQIINLFKKEGYQVDAKVLNSSNYGVPEKRKRAIFIGNSEGIKNQYPEFTKKVFLKEVLNLPYEEIPDIQHVYEKVATEKAYKFSFVKQGGNYGTFKSSNVRLRGDGFACTITKGGRYIHPIYNRLISIREAARIQSFPEDFIFTGSKENMYAQIGNAVPVKMAEAIGLKLMEIWNNDKK